MALAAARALFFLLEDLPLGGGGPFFEWPSAPAALYCFGPSPAGFLPLRGLRSSSFGFDGPFSSTFYRAVNLGVVFPLVFRVLLLPIRCSVFWRTFAVRFAGLSVVLVKLARLVFVVRLTTTDTGQGPALCRVAQRQTLRWPSPIQGFSGNH